MIRKVLTSLAAVLLIATSISPAEAKSASPIELTGDIKVYKKIVENGVEREVLADPQVVVPGDRLLFRTSYRNSGVEAVQDFVITNGLPAGVVLLPESSGAGLVSVDGGKSWGKLEAQTVDDGAGGKRPAVARDVTHLRWVLAEIQPGGRGEVTYQATVR